MNLKGKGDLNSLSNQYTYPVHLSNNCRRDELPKSFQVKVMVDNVTSVRKLIHIATDIMIQRKLVVQIINKSNAHDAAKITDVIKRH